MSPFDLSALAVRSLRRRAGRTVLTGLAVTLGTTLLVALVAISATADSRVVSQLSKGGPITAIHVDDARPAAAALQTDELATAGHHDIDLEALEAIRHSRYVSAASPVLSVAALAVPCPAADPAAKSSLGGEACVRGTDPYRATLVGADLTHARELPISIIAGRLPGPHSLTEVAVSQAYLDHLQLAPQRAASVLGTSIGFATPRVIGATGHFQQRSFRALIVGVVAQSVESGDFLVPLEQAEMARAFALTGSLDPRIVPGIGSPYSAVTVVADSLDHVHAVRVEIYDLGYASSAPEHLIASVLRYLGVVDIVLGGIGLVALCIAALGIANSLLAAVRERWREIGVFKAMGAGDQDVLMWFLSEAAILGLAGGVVGTAGGLTVAWVVGLTVNSYLTSHGLQGVDLTTVPFGLALLAPLGTALVAMAAGAAPAVKAARLPAREAIGAL